MTVSKKTRAWLTLGAAVLVLLIAVVATKVNDHRDTNGAKAVATSTVKTTAKPGGATPGTANQSAPVSKVLGVPDRAYATLVEIDAGRWPDSANAPGTHGGDPWENRSGQLPRKDSAGKAITYQEWDVNPKQRGQTRDAERIITGSDGSAYYTGDHYKTFTRMR
ncbi:ribonuclease domain-containing protein [Nocardia sp. CDC160]|uniref:ribonuclease domain-containing protein n=1 Tax=Nocardia sp. CDC160 TaxID=3112166 RepID=UPI002DB9AADA|nr:ribonuclease domain-containing protein [Nocardia sp. CDC160]MEC3913140.1 ribonuclease domain-containing protein [Nocardia sp. CDC160]